MISDQCSKIHFHCSVSKKPSEIVFNSELSQLFNAEMVPSSFLKFAKVHELVPL